MLLTLLLAQYCLAQTDPIFKLIKERGHFYCETTLNGVNAKVMVETGAHALLMGGAFYEAHKDSLKLEVMESNEKIRHIRVILHPFVKLLLAEIDLLPSWLVVGNGVCAGHLIKLTH
jgi:hypothetical protein